MELLTSNLGRLRITGFLEGISFLVLLCIAMPLKYIWGMEGATMIVGMAHGILFVLYIVLVLPVKLDYDLNSKTVFLILLSSIVPLGTFVVDHKILKKLNK